MITENDTIISEVAKEDQSKLLEFISDFLDKDNSIQVKFSSALKEFTHLPPADKKKEISAWLSVFKNILNGE